MIPKNENDLIVVDLEMTGLQVKRTGFWKSVLSESMRSDYRFVPDVCQSTPQTGGTDHRADGYYR